jgi:isoleucyl-tRNA synthetase
MFEKPKPASFPEREEKILQLWKDNRTFFLSVETRKDRPRFSFYDGPPFATGLPHYGHLLAGTIKDVVPRYKTMKGYCVERRFGWDCHGLPVENEIEKSLGLSGSASIEEYGIANFNEECRSIVLRYTKEWQHIVERMGRWVDFSNTYHTMDLTFMESVFWVFKQLFENGLVYEGHKVMPFSAKLGTPLSNFEAGENYKEVDDPSLTVRFRLENEPSTYLLIWTTTPWTLLSNLAVMAGPEIDYVQILDLKTQERYILAESRLHEYYTDPSQYEMEERYKGKDLEGFRYLPPFSYFAKRKEQGAFRVLLEDSVSTEDGTGLVHSAPAFGEVDFYACQKAGIELVCPVDNNGKFTEEIPEYQGLFVKDADKAIIKKLKEQGDVIKHATCRHRYPFCWRSDTPLIYKAVRTWFVKVEAIKEQMVQLNKQVHWTPHHIQEGRFGKWLEGARDWAISRNRYWGTPIPIWRSPSGKLHVVGSIQELETLSGRKIEDLHRHFIDDITFEKEGETYTRIPEVFDCWFESGSMPYAQNHYPFENEELFKELFPADFIAEGLDQTRGWFYTLTILSTALFQKPAFKNVIVNGIILAADGSKMSKRLKNYPDPMEVVQKYGADAVRLYMLHSPAVRADDLCFQESGVELVLRQVLIPMWNALTFFLTYAEIYKWEPQEGDWERAFHTPTSILDRWAISTLNKLIHQVEEGMNAYDLSAAVEPFIEFVENLTNWYIRRSRRRFWEEEASEDRDNAFATLYYILKELAKVAAPFIPFLAEQMWQLLKTAKMTDSVHLANYPTYRSDMRDQHLEQAMELVQKGVSLGHALRKEQKLKVRQPLSSATLVCSDSANLRFLQEHSSLIADELNVKNIYFAENEEEFVRLSAKPNFKVLGKKLGKKMPLAQKQIENFSYQALAAILAGKTQEITFPDGENFVVTSEEVEVRREVKEGQVAANSGSLTIVLDTRLTEALTLEGLAREIVNKVNAMRRDQGFEVTDRISLTIETTSTVEKAFAENRGYICREVLAEKVVFSPCEGVQWDLNGEEAKIQIHKI